MVAASVPQIFFFTAYIIGHCQKERILEVACLS